MHAISSIFFVSAFHAIFWVAYGKISLHRIVLTDLFLTYQTKAVTMESYADSKLCQQCMQRRRSRFKSVSESKHKQTRAAYICATASLVISLMAFAMCIGLQTTVVMNEDITQLHSTIKELTHEINVLKYIQSKKDYMPYNQKDKNDNLVRGNRETYSTHKKPYIEQRFEASGLLEVLKNQTESSLNESYTDRKNHKIVKRSRKNRGKKKLKHYRRRKRNHDVPTYAILRGKNERNLSNGIFKWSVIEDDRTIWVSEDMQHSISEEMVQVPYNGLYSISVRIKIEGRQHPSLTPFTPVGMSICKQGEYANGSTWNHTIDEVFLTQDDGGEIRSVYGGLAPNPPIDSLSYSNMIHLQRYDRIYVRVPESSLNDHSIQYNNKKEDSHLSIYLLLRD